MNWKDDPRWAYVLVNVSTLVWASNVVLGRALRDSIGPLTLAAARFAVAGLLYNGLLARSGPEARRPGRDWPLLAGMGLVGVFGFTGLLYRGLQLTTATNAALINGTGPLMTALLAAILLREDLPRRSIVGALLSLAGVAVIVSGGPPEIVQQWSVNAGDLLILLAVVLWGLYSVMSRVVTRWRSALSATALSTWIALPLLIIAAAVESWRAPARLDWGVVLAVLYIGIFPSVVAYLAWNEGVRRVGPRRAMAFYNMLPVFGTLFGVAFLGEAFGWPQLAGGGLVVAGSLISVWSDLRQRPPAGGD